MTFTDGTIVHAADLNALLSPGRVFTTQATVQSGITTATWSDIILNGTPATDTKAACSGAANVVIGKVIGWWLVSGVVTWVGNATGTTRRARVALNGTPINGSFSTTGPLATRVSVATPTVLVQASVGTDAVTLQGYHDATTSIAPEVTNEVRCSLTAVYIGP